MRNIAYRRCSTNEEKQSVERQLMGKTFDIEFTEYASGSNEEGRPEFRKMIDSLEKNDHVWFQEISRAGRNTSQLLASVKNMMSRGVTIHFVTENLVFTENDDNPMQAAISSMLLSMLSAVNEMQLAQLKVAVKQGVQKTKAKGTKCGAASEKYQENKKAGLHAKAKSRNTEKQRQALQPVAQEVTKIINYSNGALTLDEISNKLNEQGMLTARNNPWTKATVSKLIKQFNIEKPKLNKWGTV